MRRSRVISTWEMIMLHVHIIFFFRSNRTPMCHRPWFDWRGSSPVSSIQRIHIPTSRCRVEKKTPSCLFNLKSCYPLLLSEPVCIWPWFVFQQMYGHLMYLYSKRSHFVSLCSFEIHHFISTDRNIISHRACGQPVILYSYWVLRICHFALPMME